MDTYADNSFTAGSQQPVLAPYLPNELITIVVGHLHDDKQALQTCSRIASAWVDPSYRHLFSQIFISVDDPNWLVKLYGDIERYSRLGNYARRLMLWTFKDPNAACIPVCHHIISSILHFAPNIKDITFFGLLFDCKHGAVEHVTHSIELDRMVIRNCLSAGGPIVPLILSNFSTVKTLQIARYSGPTSTASSSRSSHLQIYDFDYDAPAAADILSTISNSPTSFAMSFHDASQIGEFNAFITSTGAEIRQLLLRPMGRLADPISIRGEDFVNLDLSLCKQLQVLRIVALGEYHLDEVIADQSQRMLWDAVAHIVSSSPSGLPVIHLDLTVEAEARDSFERTFQWESMDGTLACRPGLRSVIFTLFVEDTDLELKDEEEVYSSMITKRMHRVAKLGLLDLRLKVTQRIPHDWD
ncbi:hypothetical protein BXZ70DRAFT_100388 [Cristinia sonorae]|uniref:F-box domain-containing protein n=1 Tax=Cristinia sonorae TaxID=1940300 RepID=A0A8K0XQL0_9AGAR|nr:hypothetical protein BXZ70DRAFT_100388 [Cristinia sonorae]